MPSTSTTAHLFALDAPARSFMRPGVVTVSDDTSLRQVQRAIISHGVRAVLVTGGVHGGPLGWVTGRGLLMHLGEDLALLPAAMAVSEPLRAIEPDATAAEALDALREPGVSHLLVARGDDGRAQGVVSELDLIRLTAD